MGAAVCSTHLGRTCTHAWFHPSLDDGCYRNLGVARSRRVRKANRRLYPDAQCFRSICLHQFHSTSDLFFDDVCRCSHSWLEPSSPLCILPLPPYLIQSCSHQDPAWSRPEGGWYLISYLHKVNSAFLYVGWTRRESLLCFSLRWPVLPCSHQHPLHYRHRAYPSTQHAQSK